MAGALSQRLGIPYYDKDFVEKTVEASGYDKELVEREGEEISVAERVLNSFLNSAVSFSSSHDAIFQAEKKVVLELAKEPCIIIGRCADRILKEAGQEPFAIYLYAPAEKRVKRAEELAENGEMNPEKYIEKRDKQRRTYYKQYTGHEMGDTSNYTICFDTSRISISARADIVEMLLKREN